ncbi:hypothetical protein IE53DRAFT_338588 [Violaceomyces palustris]|uniref:Uncharacterized protein n=1 Tax=Violaceomyces palustris TaxID=1673888 RepID=A0ACD0P602_9BASI|nr:hypothetical protein IE53DRAFT_338588 [Violaceomyces palustris]
MDSAAITTRSRQWNPSSSEKKLDEAPSQSLASPQLQQGGANSQATNRLRVRADSSSLSPALTQQRPISEPELLAIVVEKRLKASSTRVKEKDEARPNTQHSSSPLNPGGGQQSQSENSIDTLDLCHHKIETVPEGLTDIIKDDVVRLALGYNLIASLPSNFGQLACVRYLNIRANNIAEFPDVVCRMPSLEILDISRNKIRKLPNEPGHLTRLRVLSMTNNRLVRLPTWIPRMNHLRILKAENNPLEWPPPHISTIPSLAPSKFSSDKIDREARKRADDRNMVTWIARLKAWIDGNSQLDESGRETELSPDQDATDAVLALRVEKPELQYPTVGGIPVQTQTGEDALVSAENEESCRSNGPAARPLLSSNAEAVPSSDFSVQAQHSPSLSPTVSTGTEGQSPISVQRTRVDAYVNEVLLESRESRQLDQVKSKSQHGRNNSHSIGQSETSQQQGLKRGLKAKKSLPDLRLSHDDILSERILLSSDSGTLTIPSPVPVAEGQPVPQPSSAPPPRKPSTTARRPPLPQSASNPLTFQNKQSTTGWSSTTASPSQSSNTNGGGLRKLSLPTVGATQAAADAAAAAMAARSGSYSNTPPKADGHGRMASGTGDGGLVSRSDSPAAGGPVDVERNSYFRRLSTLPPSTISKAVPLPVLKFVDATRGVLFALSQIHSALKQYILFATDERISSQFNRVLDVASGSLAIFINSLDRFDGLSRRGTPEPSVIRGVLSACKESVGTFRKVVSVLQLQLRALQGSADVRFTRTLLLMLYGSMAEVSNSWSAMSPQVDAVLPYLSGSTEAPGFNRAVVTAASGNTKAATGNSVTTTPTLPSIAESVSPLRSGARPYVIPQRPARRRHAGSFSAQDVAQGATIPPSAPPGQTFRLEDLQPTSSNPTSANSSASRPSLRLKPLLPAPPTSSIPPLSSTATLGSASGSNANGSFQDILTHINSMPQTPGAPTTPVTGPAQARAPGTNPASASPSRRFRSGSNASSGDGLEGRGAFNGLQPMTPSQKQSQGHAQAQINLQQAGMGAGSSAVGGSSGTQVVIDDHLLTLVDEVTAIADDVWTALLEDLSELGLHDEESQGNAGLENSNVNRDIHDQSSEIMASSNANTTNSQGRSDLVTDENQFLNNLTKKLRDLEDLGVNTADLTRRLRLTMERVRSESDPATPYDEGGIVEGDADLRGLKHRAWISGNVEVKKLWEEANHFVRAIIHISTLIKAVSVDHVFPRDLLRSLGEVTHGCSALAVHLHWLSATE